MKSFQHLFLTLCLILFSATIYAQSDCNSNSAYICENFDSYDASIPLGPQSSNWTTWSGAVNGDEEGIVSNAYSNSGNQSLKVQGTAANGGPQDVVLMLGNQTSGRYRVRFDIYIPSGKGAYYNLQHVFNGATATYQWASQITFTNAGLAQLDAGVAGAAILAYNHDEWIRVDQIIDMDADVTSISLGGRHMHTWPFSDEAVTAGTGTNQMAALDFFPLDNTHEFYIDDLIVEALPVCSLDPEAIICDDMEAYPVGEYTGPLSSFWSTWSGTEGTAEDGVVTDAYAASGSNSMLVSNSGTQDVTVQLGNRTQGNYTTQFKLYIPSGKDGYFNLHSEEVYVMGVTDWLGEFYFGFDGPQTNNDTEGIGTTNLGATTFTYPPDQWFEVRADVDLDLNLLNFWVDGNQVFTDFPIADLTLGMIDFYSASNTMEMYVDDLLFKQLSSSEINCASSTLGTTNTTSSIVCWGEPFSVGVGGTSVIPTFNLDDTLSGFTWIISTESITGSTDPFNEPSFTGVWSGFLVDEVYDLTGINNGSGLQPGAYFFTPVSLGTVINVNNTFPGLDLSAGCVTTGNSVSLILSGQISAITITATATDAMNGNNDGTATATASGGVGIYEFLWSNGATTAEITGLAPGDYTVTVTSLDDNGCVGSSLSETVTVADVTAVENIEILESLSIAPNPTKGLVSINMHLTETAIVDLQVINVNGQVVASFASESTSNYQNAIDLSTLSDGLYFAKIIVGNDMLVKKIQVSK